MSRSGRRPTEDLSDLASRIEAELSGGSRESLRQLLAQLSPAQDDEDDTLYEDDEEGDFEGGADRYRPWDARPFDARPFDARPFDARPFDDGDEDLEDDLEGPQEPGPYWWRQRSTSRRVPVPVEGGLLARSQRGPIGETWWSQRFLAAVGTALVGGRSSRGRSYARKGQVMELWVGPGVIRGTVQGTRSTPYDVCIVMPAADDAQWGRILASLAGQALYSASMLAGELPHEIEEVFAGVGVALFPSPTSRLSSSCTCPDWANPCKHVAAVSYLVAEQFDRDPFVLLAWRGCERDEILRRLRELRGVAVATPGTPPPSLRARSPGPPSPPLSECLAGFWKAGPELASLQVRPCAADVAGAVLRQLPQGAPDAGGQELRELFGPVYKEMAAAAQQRAVRSTPRPG